MSKQSKPELIEAIQHRVAEFQQLADQYDEAAAALLGVNRTDLRLLGLLSLRGSLTAGELAAAAALSPAATSTAIQRIVAAGHARREAAAEDRRRAVISLTRRTESRIAEIYAAVAEAGRRQLAGYTERELRVIQDFLSHGNDLLAERAARLRRAGRSRRT